MVLGLGRYLMGSRLRCLWDIMEFHGIRTARPEGPALGVGKSHVMTAIGHELVHQSHSVLFATVSALAERLLKAKHDLRLTRELHWLHRIECGENN